MKTHSPNTAQPPVSVKQTKTAVLPPMKMMYGVPFSTSLVNVFHALNAVNTTGVMLLTHVSMPQSAVTPTLMSLTGCLTSSLMTKTAAQFMMHTSLTEYVAMVMTVALMVSTGMRKPSLAQPASVKSAVNTDVVMNSTTSSTELMMKCTTKSMTPSKSTTMPGSKISTNGGTLVK